MRSWKKVGVTVLLLMMVAGSAFAANVTFQVNMDIQNQLGNFDPDAGDIVVVRGDMNGWAGTDLQCTDDDADMIFTLTTPIDDGTYGFKYVIVPGDASPDIWETAIDNRSLTVAGDDVVLDVVYFNDLDHIVESYNVTFQLRMDVQMESGAFDPDAGDFVVVRGDFNGWSGVAETLTDDDGDSVYTGTWEMDEGTYGFKYVMITDEGATETWESRDNRSFTLDGGDLVLDPVYFDDQEIVLIPTDVEVLFRVDMSVQIINGNFDPDADQVVVRGGHESIGNWGGDTAPVLVREQGTDIYSSFVQFDQLAVIVPYKFVIHTGGNPDTPVWEELPQGGNRTFYAMQGLEDNFPPGGNGYVELFLDPVFFSDNEGGPDVDVDLTFVLDTRAVYYRFEEDTDFAASIGSIDAFYVAGPWNEWPWNDFGPEFELHDDGVAPDETAGDSIYTVTLTFLQDSGLDVIYKFGINGLDNEGPVGANHSFHMERDVTEQTVVDTFGTVGDWFDEWIDRLGVRDLGFSTVIPVNFSLKGNYPNPFNPATNISFNLPTPSVVTLRVFNLLGQQVASLTTNKLSAGSHAIFFDAAKLSSGTYFYQVEAAGQKLTGKMMLLK